LLDENFPLRFYTRLQREGFSVEHILLTDRGIQDKQIIARLMQEEVLFLTQDEDFVEAAPDSKASIIWSRVSQSWRSIEGLKSGSTPLRNSSQNNGAKNSLSYTTTDSSIRSKL
jgi:predicted nuclease of predicted toxin-antitoxin system